MNICPLFLVGAERSGTTVFRLMLDHHPEIAVCSEFEYVVDPIVGREEWPSTNEFYAYLQSNWIFQLHNFEIDPTLSYPELANNFLEQLCQRDQARYVIATVHRNFDQLERIWPHSRYIHIVRDPRDVARSVIKMGWAGNVWYALRFWLKAEHMWERMKAQLPSDRWMDVRYEELIAAPTTVLRQVCQFIGVDYSPRMLDYPAYTTYSKPDSTLINQWQHKLRPQEIALVEARVGSLLHQRGYSLSGVSACFPSLPMRLWLYVHDKLGRQLHRMEHLGFRLFISEYISRKLNIKPWQAQLEPQLAEVWRKSLK